MSEFARNHPYIPATDHDREGMLKQVGVESVEELFNSIPEKFREIAGDTSRLPKEHSEQEILELLSKVSNQNLHSGNSSSFLGGGGYRHFIPSVIDQLVARGEFLTCYTPYQPEVSQGTLQAMFEYQSMACEVTGMEISNAGLYDSATSVVEAVLMCLRVKKSALKLVLPLSLSSNLREVVKTNLQWHEEVTIVEAPYNPATGKLEVRDLEGLVGEETLCVVCGYPNFFGVVEDLAEISDFVQQHGGFLISNTSEALALSVIDSPGRLGADIATGDFQSFGVPLSFGGPWCGFFCTKEKYIRQLPGRLAGVTEDLDGKRGFVLTLSTREQHIRRDKATSNICTNNQLLALCVTIYLSLHGPEGFRELGIDNAKRRLLFESLIADSELVEKRFSGQCFNEVCLDVSRLVLKHNLSGAEELQRKLADKGILVGPVTEEGLLVSFTEENSEEDIKELAEALV